jgi:hypothetical protein
MSQAEFETNWKSLYRVGGTAALIAAGLEIAAALIVAITLHPPLAWAAKTAFATSFYRWV